MWNTRSNVSSGSPLSEGLLYIPKHECLGSTQRLLHYVLLFLMICGKMFSNFPSSSIDITEFYIKRRSSHAPNLIHVGALSATEERRLIQLRAAERIKCDRAHLERQGLPHNTTLGRHRSERVPN